MFKAVYFSINFKLNVINPFSAMGNFRHHNSEHISVQKMSTSTLIHVLEMYIEIKCSSKQLTVKKMPPDGWMLDKRATRDKQPIHLTSTHACITGTTSTQRVNVSKLIYLHKGSNYLQIITSFV